MSENILSATDRNARACEVCLREVITPSREALVEAGQGASRSALAVPRSSDMDDADFTLDEIMTLLNYVTKRLDTFHRAVEEYKRQGERGTRKLKQSQHRLARFESLERKLQALMPAQLPGLTNDTTTVVEN